MIRISFNADEVRRPRADKLRDAIAKDDRFELAPPGNHPFDLRIDYSIVCPQCHGKGYPEAYCEECDQVHAVTCGVCLSSGKVTKTLYVELKDFTGKDNSDYLNSIRNGHLWEQVQSGRELGYPVVIAVLGDDKDVASAARKAARHEDHTFDLKKFLSYCNMIEGFEANCIALQVPVWRLKDNPWDRLLLRVRKILEGGNLDGFRPQPAGNERQAVALSILAGRGIGPEKARSILEKFEIQLWPKGEDFGYCPPVLEDCKGIGPKLAETVRQNLKVMEVGCE